MPVNPPVNAKAVMISNIISSHFIRRFTFLLLLLTGLIIANSYYRTIAEQDTILAGLPGEVLYAAGFDGFEDEWQQYDGRLAASIAEGVLTIRLDTISTAYSASQHQFADFDLSVRTIALDGPIDNGFGVIFGLQEPRELCDMPLEVLCEVARMDALGIPLRLLFRPQSRFASGYYMFLISSDGYYSVWRSETVDGATRARAISTWIPSERIQQDLNNPNTLRIVAQNNFYRFFINGEQMPLCIPNNPDDESTYALGSCIGGQMVDSWQDTAFATGKIGLVGHATATGGPGIVVSFDDLIILSPSDEGAVQT